MLVNPRPAAQAGQVHFAFERLPVQIGACTGIVCGAAIIFFDVNGHWWVGQIIVSGPRERMLPWFLPVSDPLFSEICCRLDQNQVDNIAERINRALAEGGHMALFGEGFPHAGARSEPPRSRRRWGAAAAFAPFAELVCLAMLATGLIGMGLAANAPASLARWTPRTPLLVALSPMDGRP